LARRVPAEDVTATVCEWKPTDVDQQFMSRNFSNLKNVNFMFERPEPDGWQAAFERCAGGSCGGEARSPGPVWVLPSATRLRARPARRHAAGFCAAAASGHGPQSSVRTCVSHADSQCLVPVRCKRRLDAA